MDSPVFRTSSVPASRLPAGLYGRVLALRRLAELERGIHSVMEGQDNDPFHLIHSALPAFASILRGFGPWPDEVARARSRLAPLRRRADRLRRLGSDLALLEALTKAEGADAEELEWALVGFRWRHGRLAEELAEASAGLLPVIPVLRGTIARASVRLDEAGIGDGPSGGLLLLGRAWELQERLARRLDRAIEQPAGRSLLRASGEALRLRVLLGALADEGHAGARLALGSLPRLVELLDALETVVRLRGRLRELLQRGSRPEVKAWRALERQEAVQPVFAALDLRERDLVGALRRGRDHGRWSERIRIQPDAGPDATPALTGAPGLETAPTDPSAGTPSGPARAEPSFRERRFLLRALPTIPAEVEPVRVIDGFLPDDPAIAGLRIVEPVEGPSERRRLFRAAAPHPSGPLSSPEDLPPGPVFDALWPLTEGCRLRRLRWRMPHGQTEWIVESVPALRLLLARTAVPEGAPEEPVPPWLAPVVLREITGEEGWDGESLARAGPPTDRSE